MDLVKEAGEEKAEEEAEASEDSSRPDVASNVVADEEEADDTDKKPKNALRKVSKTGFGEKEEYLRYYILASNVATCR
jgi:hypothetical protein